MNNLHIINLIQHIEYIDRALQNPEDPSPDYFRRRSLCTRTQGVFSASTRHSCNCCLYVSRWNFRRILRNTFSRMDRQEIISLVKDLAASPDKRHFLTTRDWWFEFLQAINTEKILLLLPDLAASPDTQPLLTQDVLIDAFWEMHSRENFQGIITLVQNLAASPDMRVLLTERVLINAFLAVCHLRDCQGINTLVQNLAASPDTRGLLTKNVLENAFEEIGMRRDYQGIITLVHNLAANPDTQDLLGKIVLRRALRNLNPEEISYLKRDPEVYSALFVVNLDTVPPTFPKISQNTSLIVNVEMNNRGLSLGPQFPEGTENNLNYLDHLLEIADNLQFSVGSSQNLSSSSVHSEFSDFSQEDITALGLDSSSNIKDVIKTHLSTFINNIKNNIRIADAPENDDERKNQFYTPIRQNLYPVIVFLLEHRDDERIKSFIIEIAKASSWCSTRYNQLSRAAYVMFFPSLEQTEFSPFENILFKILRQEREEVFNRIFTKATIEGHLAYYQGGNHYHINNVHADRLLDQLCGRFGIKTFQNYDDPNHPIIDLNVLRTLTNQFYTTYNSEAVVLRVTDVLRSDFDFRESFFNYLDSHVPEDFDPASLELPEDIRLQPFDKFQEENCRGKTPQEVIDLYAEKKKTSYKFLFQNIASGEWNEEKIQELLVSIGVFQRNPLVQDGSEILFL